MRYVNCNDCESIFFLCVMQQIRSNNFGDKGAVLLFVFSLNHDLSGGSDDCMTKYRPVGKQHKFLFVRFVHLANSIVIILGSFRYV